MGQIADDALWLQMKKIDIAALKRASAGERMALTEAHGASRARNVTGSAFAFSEPVPKSISPET